jgi:general secretion pathway protein G
MTSRHPLPLTASKPTFNTAMEDSLMTIETLEQEPQPEVVRAVAARGTRGMTLIEILVVLAIIGLIMGGVAIMAFNAFDDSKQKAAAKDIANLASSVEMYRLSKNKCPKSVQDLKAAGIIARVTKDPWGNDFVIKCPGEHGAVDITSNGKDGEAGTEDDINSWDDNVGEVKEEGK